MTSRERQRVRQLERLTPRQVRLGTFYRQFPVGSGTWYDQTSQGMEQFYTVPPFRAARAEGMLDEIHRFPYKEGGPMQAVKYWSDYPLDGVFGQGSYQTSDGLWKYVGGMGPPPDYLFGYPIGSYPGDGGLVNLSIPYVLNQFPDTESFGTQAWNRAKPKLETAGGFVFIAELSDIPHALESTGRFFSDLWRNLVSNGVPGAVRPQGSLRNLLNSRSMTPHGVADAFVNEQFGWAPFVGDIVSFCKTMIYAQDTIDGLTAKNGKTVRRRVPVKVDSATSVVGPYGLGRDIVPGVPVGMPQNTLNGETLQTVTEETFLNVVAEGAFRYFRPEFDKSSNDYYSLWGRILRQIDIYGLRINPYHLYQVIPWSWAIDWVTNAGDYVRNFSDMIDDSLTAVYFYVMANKTVRKTVSYEIPFHSGPVSLSFSRNWEMKQRLGANSPYGFSLTWKDLSPRQIAIAAALGITRL
ncbi:TPA_asm: maturation protein [ssRNA phage Gephyllon.3_18]|uniref:Maturation protein n=2 Tax=Leviviricetes TaxID=2842243 RepID=A0A8S5L340_9VIRU|nr:maturation protein [ssRNA phage Gephyllon.3_18]QDH86576.1 MAG: hypothetical protein H3BulkLitter17996_000003 [Leviviridae sp.]DAD52089.1 TPA_asm: maturation protein [ssRNA phage Gephyllon.3_18]